MEKLEESMLEILIKERISSSLENTLKKNENYQLAEQEMRKTERKATASGLNKRQRELVDEAFSAVNSCVAAYGMAAYRQGFYDGAGLVLELNELRQNNFAPKKRK